MGSQGWVFIGFVILVIGFFILVGLVVGLLKMVVFIGCVRGGVVVISLERPGDPSRHIHLGGSWPKYRCTGLFLEAFCGGMGKILLGMTWDCICLK